MHKGDTKTPESGWLFDTVTVTVETDRSTGSVAPWNPTDRWSAPSQSSSSPSLSLIEGLNSPSSNLPVKRDS